jgi:apolipoprotein N-acyltransferase
MLGGFATAPPSTKSLFELARSMLKRKTNQGKKDTEGMEGVDSAGSNVVSRVEALEGQDDNQVSKASPAKSETTEINTEVEAVSISVTDTQGENNNESTKPQSSKANSDTTVNHTSQSNLSTPMKDPFRIFKLVKTPLGSFFLAVILAFLYGGLRNSPLVKPDGSIAFQRSVSYIAASETMMNVGCATTSSLESVTVEEIRGFANATRMSIPFNITYWEDHLLGMFYQTQKLVDAGSSFVVWSEVAGVLPSNATDPDYNERRFYDLSANFAKRNEIHLMVAYAKFMPNPPGVEGPRKFKNMLALFGPKGDLLMSYQKSILVPFREARTAIPGPSVMPVVDVPIGQLEVKFGKNTSKGNATTPPSSVDKTSRPLRIGAGICFELTSFPSTHSLLTTYNAVDLLVQPAANWGPIGYLDFPTVGLRIVENGVGSLVRCTDDGISGVIDWRGQVMHFQMNGGYGEGIETNVGTGVHGLGMATIPVRKRVWVLYPYFGFLFGWACLVVSVVGLTAVGRKAWYIRKSEKRSIAVTQNEQNEGL